MEGDAVLPAQDCNRIRADLVCHISVPCRPVSADDREVNETSFHKRSGGIIGYQRHRYVSLHQFPRCKTGALQYRPCFIGNYLYAFALVLCNQHRGSSRTVSAGGKAAGIAMCKYSIPVPDKAGSPSSNSLVYLYIFFEYPLCLIYKQLFNSAHLFVFSSGEQSFDPLHRPLYINCSGPGGKQG